MAISFPFPSGALRARMAVLGPSLRSDPIAFYDSRRRKSRAPPRSHGWVDGRATRVHAPRRRREAEERGSMTNERVGRAAGVVWAHLREREEKGSTLNELKRKVEGFTADEIVAAIGWLAREGK